MYVTTNSAIVWKRMADENQQSARLMARISIGLAALVLLTGAYAFTTNVRYGTLCTSIAIKSNGAPQPARELGQDIVSTYCS